MPKLSSMPDVYFEAREVWEVSYSDLTKSSTYKFTREGEEGEERVGEREEGEERREEGSAKRRAKKRIDKEKGIMEGIGVRYLQYMCITCIYHNIYTCNMYMYTYTYTYTYI